MKELRRKTKVVLLIVVLFNLVLSSISSYAFYYIEDSMYEEIANVEFELVLDERDYYLVIDNTGYISGVYERNFSHVSFTTTFHGEYPNNFGVSSGSSYAKDSRYVPCPFSLEKRGNMSFEITAAEPVTVFVTTLDGLEQFESEISEFLDEGWIYRDNYILIDIVGGLLIMSVAAVIYARKRIRKDVKKNE